MPSTSPPRVTEPEIVVSKRFLLRRDSVLTNCSGGTVERARLNGSGRDLLAECGSSDSAGEMISG